MPRGDRATEPLASADTVMRMGFLSRVRSLFGSDVSADGRSMLAQIFPAGVPPRRGTRELLMAYRTMPWLHAAIHKIGEAVAGTNWRLYKHSGRTGGTQLRHVVTRDASSGVYVMDGATEVTSHPFLDLLRKPNPTLHRAPFWSTLAAFDDLKGECPLVIERDASGDPLELWPIPPHWLNFTPTAADPTYKFVWNGWRRSVPESDVLYLTRPDPENPYGRGCGNAEALADELDIDEFAAKHVAAFFYNRAMPDAFISLDGVKSVEQAEAWEERIRNKYRGSARAWQFHVTNAKMTVTTVAQNFKNVELQAMRQAQRDVVLQVLGCPPEIFGIVENSNRATVSAADFIFTSKVVLPRLNYFAGALTTFVQEEYGDEYFVAFDSPVAEDLDFIFSVMTAQPSLFTRNEWRRIAKHPPVEGWDDEWASGTPGAMPGVGPGQTPPQQQLPAGQPQVVEDPPSEEDPAVEDDPTDASEKGAKRVRRLVAGKLRLTSA